MTTYYIALALVFLFASPGESQLILNPFFNRAKNTGQFLSNAYNKTSGVVEALLQPNETTLANFTYTLYTNESTSETLLPKKVDCLGLGETVATLMEYSFRSEPNGTHALDVKFFLSSRIQPRRVQVVLGEQFGLEWTDFRIERRTVIIVHGFLSHGEVEWVKDMEKAFLEWVSN